MMLKIVGALYLLWLGFSSFRAFWHNHYEKAPQAQKATFHFWKSLREGFLSNVLNPKAVIFYMAFLPQFISPESSPLLQSMFLASLHFIVATIWQSILIIMICSANGFIMKKSVRKSMDFIAGSVMVLLGIKLFLAQR